MTPDAGTHVAAIVGHVRTSEMHADGSYGAFHDGNKHYYIDGSAEETGKLNLLRYTVAG